MTNEPKPSCPLCWRPTPQAELRTLLPGRYLHKLLLDGERWQDDPSNPQKAPDGLGGFNNVLIVGEKTEHKMLQFAGRQ